MRPPKKDNKNYEKVAIGEMISGIIDKVEYDNEHKFKGFEGKEDTIQLGIRLKLKLDGYQYHHYSRWMKFNLGEKSNLYKKYVSKLMENAVPDMDFDLDVLNGMKIKTVWSEDKGFQNIDAIYPNQPKIKPDAVVPQMEEGGLMQEDHTEDTEINEETPF